MIQELTRLATEHGAALVFLFVLVEQLGAPIPALPLLVVVGALAADGHLSPSLLLASALAAALAGDLVWYAAGRRFGHRVLKTLCRISISPDTCVRQTEDVFLRHGPASLVFAKFVPGWSTVAPPIAGALNMGTGRFLAYDTAGALLWAGAGIALGWLFHAQVDAVLEALQAAGGWGLSLLGAALGVFLAVKAWERQKVYRALAAARISPEELYRLMDEGHDPVILDVRSNANRALDLRRIPGAIAVDFDTIEAEIARLPRDREVVVYCACPNEASAAKLAALLRRRGFERARPLQGGIDAWQAAGLRLERP